MFIAVYYHTLPYGTSSTCARVVLNVNHRVYIHFVLFFTTKDIRFSKAIKWNLIGIQRDAPKWKQSILGQIRSVDLCPENVPSVRIPTFRERGCKVDTSNVDIAALHPITRLAGWGRDSFSLPGRVRVGLLPGLATSLCHLWADIYHAPATPTLPPSRRLSSSPRSDPLRSMASHKELIGYLLFGVGFKYC